MLRFIGLACIFGFEFAQLKVSRQFPPQANSLSHLLPQSFILQIVSGVASIDLLVWSRLRRTLGRAKKTRPCPSGVRPIRGVQSNCVRARVYRPVRNLGLDSWPIARSAKVTLRVQCPKTPKSVIMISAKIFHVLHRKQWTKTKRWLTCSNVSAAKKNNTSANRARLVARAEALDRADSRHHQASSVGGKPWRSQHQPDRARPCTNRKRCG